MTNRFETCPATSMCITFCNCFWLELCPAFSSSPDVQQSTRHPAVHPASSGSARMAHAFITDDDTPLPAAVEPEVAVVQAPVIASLSSLQVAKGEELAMERWHRLNRPQCELGRSPGTLWAGSCQEAGQGAGQHVAYIVNEARVDFTWHPWCLRLWANINYKGILNHVTHEHRICVVVWLILTAMAMGEDALVHCRQGKRRSSALCLLILLIIGRQSLCKPSE